MDTSEAIRAVLAEEVARQRRTLAEVSRAAGVSKNTLARVVKKKGTLEAQTLWALARALEVPVAEIAFRVDQRLR